MLAGQAPVSAGPHSSRSGPAACLRKAGESSTQTAGGWVDLAAQWRCRGGTRSGPQILDLFKAQPEVACSPNHSNTLCCLFHHLRSPPVAHVFSCAQFANSHTMMLLMWSIIYLHRCPCGASKQYTVAPMCVMRGHVYSTYPSFSLSDMTLLHTCSLSTPGRR